MTSPEHNLLHAIIESAISDLESSVKSRRRGAADWFMCEDEPFPSFRAVCDYLEFSPSAIRRSLNHLITPALGDVKPAEERHAAAAPIPHDPNLDHDYRSAHHCRECYRQWQAYYRSNDCKATVGRPRRAA